MNVLDLRNARYQRDDEDALMTEIQKWHARPAEFEYDLGLEAGMLSDEKIAFCYDINL